MKPWIIFKGQLFIH